MNVKEICVDCSVTISNPGKAEYRGMDMETGNILFEYQFPMMVSNNIAEWIAIVHAIKYCLDKGLKRTKIYSDSKIAIKWVRIGKHLSKMKTKYPHLYTAHLDKILNRANSFLQETEYYNDVVWWDKRKLGKEIMADYGRK